jgi:hypothetical protein
MRKKALSTTAWFAILLSGCAGPGAYRFADRVLIPPGVKRADISTRTVTLPLAVKCRTSETAVTLVPAGRAVRVTVKPAQLRAQAAGSLIRWTESLEQRGCLSGGDASKLAAQVTEIVPLEPRVASSLLHPPERAYVDLDPGGRLSVVGPWFREGTKPETRAIESVSANGLTLTVKASADLLGVETVWYAIEPYADRPGVHFVFLSVEDREGALVTHPDHPHLDYLHFTPDAALYRLFTITRRSQSNHDMMLVAAATTSQLDQATKRLEADASSCADLAASHVCVEIPRDVVLALAPVVTANGAALAVQGRGTVGDVLLSAGVKRPASVLSTLRVQKRYLDRLALVNFDRSQPSILDLPLLGGEILRW